MVVAGLDHVSLLVADKVRALAFYQGVLGLGLLPRPQLGFDGAWLDVGAGQSIHVMVLSSPDPTDGRPAHGGRDRHLALRVDSLVVARARLDAAGVPYTLSRSGRASLFCRDPDGNAVELMEVAH